jgi:hypothetical protein
LGNNYGVRNDLIISNHIIPCLNNRENYLWIRNNKLEFNRIPHYPMAPLLLPPPYQDTFKLYLDVIKGGTKEATDTFLRSVYILKEIIVDPNNNSDYNIQIVTPELLESFMENGVLKPFCCNYFDDYSSHHYY